MASPFGPDAESADSPIPLKLAAAYSPAIIPEKIPMPESKPEPRTLAAAEPIFSPNPPQACCPIEKSEQRAELEEPIVG